MKITPFISNRIYPTNFKGNMKANKFPENEKHTNDNKLNKNFQIKNEANKDTFTRQDSAKQVATPNYSDLIYGRIFLY